MATAHVFSASSSVLDDVADAGTLEQLGLEISALSDRRSVGLKEALQIGADNAVSLTGRPDGCFTEAIKILLPGI
jgi:hypothetical protein